MIETGNRSSKTRRGWMGILLLIALAVSAGGYWDSLHQMQEVDQELRSAMLGQAISIARTIDPELVKALSFTAADADLPEFKALRQQLTAYQTITGYRGIYTLSLQAGELYFGPESYAEDDPQASPVGTLYEQPLEEDVQIFDTAQPFTSGPYTDEYGSFVSALAPVVDPRSGEVLMVVGIDLETTDWSATLQAARANSASRVAVLAAILLGGALIMRLSPERFRWLRYREVLFISVFGLAITLILAQLAHQSEIDSRNVTFGQLADNKAHLLRNAFVNLQDQRLGSVVKFFESSEAVERQEFAEFTAPMLRRAAIQAMAWVQPVPASELDTWEALARQDGLQDFFIWELQDGQRIPVVDRDMYYPVWYVEPEEENSAAYGFDEGSESLRRTALLQAIESGLTTATDPIVLVIDDMDILSLAVFAPVHKDNGRELLGVALVVARLDIFLQSVLLFDSLDEGTAVVDLYQIDESEDAIFLASSSAEHSQLHRQQVALPGSALVENQDLHAIYPLFVFNKTYAIVVQADDAFLAAYPLKSRVTTALLGILFTALVAGITFYLSNRRAFLEEEVYARTIELEASQSDLLSAYDATIEGWSRALELRDEETEGHTRRVTRLTEQLARAMGIDEDELEHIRRGAMLHDIGKIGIPDKILRKPRQLSQKEWNAVRRHPEYAYEMLSAIDYLRPALIIPFCHHEKWDGSGYPRGLRGNDIPLAARIFAVVDVYDALTSDRPYRKAWPKQKALQYIKEQSGRHFDPRAVALFFSEMINLDFRK